MPKVKNNKSTSPQWHSMPKEETLSVLQSSTHGLTLKEAEDRLNEYGLNKLPEAKSKSALKRFILQFHNVLIYVLLASALVTAYLQHITDTVVILIVVITNACIGFFQEGKAEKAMQAIRHMLAPTATVLRDKTLMKVDAELLVPGDIIFIEAGDKIPADMRLLETYSLLIEEALLTGESLPSNKHHQTVSSAASIGDRNNMAFSGTIVAAGQAKGIVIATGTHTEIGKISHLLSSIQHLTTPLVEQMNSFAKWITLIILCVSALLLVFGHYTQQHDFADLFMVVVGLAVAAIPEGLPAVLTITLAIGVQTMAKRHAIVRRLPAIETLGSVSVICTDKTGTLTRNEMMVATVVTSYQQLSISGNGYEPTGCINDNSTTINAENNSTLLNLARAACLCNDAELHNNNDNWGVIGDPMEGALLSFARKASLNENTERNQWVRTDFIPFDAKHRFMATLNHNHHQQAFIFLKGAPEQILAMCELQASASGNDEKLNESYWLQHIEKVTNQGQRVLALAIKPVPSQNTTLEFNDIHQLTLLGIVGLIDPPRQESITAVAECISAGIKVKMITGDHAGTAKAIAKQIGLSNTQNVLTGIEIDTINDADLHNIVLHTDIFARTSPQHKLRLVKALQAHHLIVAMTGDGVNDAPALKRADIGIAMGVKGSEAAKESSDIVLADDNFSSIVAAVREGRTVYNNIKKVISWTLPTNAGESLTIIVALLFGMTLPLIPIQILWVNLITSATLGIALAFEPSDKNTMQQTPRPRHEALISGSLIWHIIFVSLLFLCGVFGVFSYAMQQGYSIELARTMALNTIVIMEIFHLLFIRHLFAKQFSFNYFSGAKALWVAISITLLGQLLITYTPSLQAIFETRSIALFDGLFIFFVGAMLLFIIESEKHLRIYLSNLYQRK
jgi:calcium-translocating P-type ATPase